jgi:ABC-type multidrug transport system ATPase subunit
LVLTTHHLDEAEILADRIAIMAAGKLLACGTSHYVKENFGQGYELEVPRECRSIVEQELKGAVLDP